MEKLKDVKEIILPADFLELVNELDDSDGVVVRTILYCDDGLRTVLEEMDFARRNIRGSYGGTEALKKVYNSGKGYKSVVEAIVAFCKERDIKVKQTVVTYSYEDVEIE